jgi:hypothetical protein
MQTRWPRDRQGSRPCLPGTVSPLHSQPMVFVFLMLKPDVIPGLPYNRPAARAQRYLAPSTATGFSVV